ncbi:MAG: GNAT family N-acetyltransferase, partial [Steroidobacteraceae bacterium]
LTSIVAKGVGHTTQLCVLPGYRGRGLGGHLMRASVEALRRLKATELSLTVTSNNSNAVKLYEALGFNAVKSFVAAVWKE